jgi:hypothetical protein
MKTIHKYTLSGSQNESILMPFDATIIHVNYQLGCLTIWAHVDTWQDSEIRTFAVFGTGWEIPENLNCEHIGTVQVDHLVWHVFEVLK